MTTKCEFVLCARADLNHVRKRAVLHLDGDNGADMDDDGWSGASRSETRPCHRMLNHD